MLDLLILFYLIGVVSFLEALLDKWGIWDYIQKLGSNSSSEFIYKLTSCRFCLRFHLSWIVCLLVIVFYSRNLGLFLMPISIGGYINLLTRK